VNDYNFCLLPNLPELLTENGSISFFIDVSGASNARLALFGAVFGCASHLGFVDVGLHLRFLLPGLHALQSELFSACALPV